MVWDNIRGIDSEAGNVCKLIFTKPDAVAESVLYRYPTYTERTVICCSTQSGCPVGCRFCGAGDYFNRNLSPEEIVGQVNAAMAHSGTSASRMRRLQIMFMSMGEPLLNAKNACEAIRRLHSQYPRAELLLSTVGPAVGWELIFDVSSEVEQVGLQFSVHESTDESRDELIPFTRKLTLEGIARAGEEWNRYTDRRPFFNYCAHDYNTRATDADRLRDLFEPRLWQCTISVICGRNAGFPSRNAHQIELAQMFSEEMMARGFDVRVFDPAGQDDIGGGCGQLWQTQQWMKDNSRYAKRSMGNGLPVVDVPR